MDLAAVPAKPTSRVSLAAIPVARQLPGIGVRELVVTANSRVPSGAAAVTSACVHDHAPEQYCFVPRSCQPSPVCAARRPGPGGLAAHTPHLLPAGGAGPSSSARIASASA